MPPAASRINTDLWLEHTYCNMFSFHLLHHPGFSSVDWRQLSAVWMSRCPGDLLHTFLPHVPSGYPGRHAGGTMLPPVSTRWEAALEKCSIRASHARKHTSEVKYLQPLCVFAFHKKKRENVEAELAHRAWLPVNDCCESCRNDGVCSVLKALRGLYEWRIGLIPACWQV